jgi:hypothetical protein
MSSRRKFLQDPPDPAIIAFAEELGRMLARREFARLEQTAERLQKDAKVMVSSQPFLMQRFLAHQSMAVPVSSL